MTQEGYVRSEKDYACPAYKTATRSGTLTTTGSSSNYILDIHLPTDRSPNYWILRGTAILCQPDTI